MGQTQGHCYVAGATVHPYHPRACSQRARQGQHITARPDHSAGHCRSDSCCGLGFGIIGLRDGQFKPLRIQLQREFDPVCQRPGLVEARCAMHQCHSVRRDIRLWGNEQGLT